MRENFQPARVIIGTACQSISAEVVCAPYENVSRTKSQPDDL